MRPHLKIKKFEMASLLALTSCFCPLGNIGIEWWRKVDILLREKTREKACVAPVQRSLSIYLSIYLSNLYQPTNWPSHQRTWGVIGKLHFQQWRNLTLTYLVLFTFRLVTLPTVPCELRGGSNENDVEMTTLAGKSWKTRPGFEEVNIGLYPPQNVAQDWSIWYTGCSD